jgi:hypothetical protein
MAFVLEAREVIERNLKILAGWEGKASTCPEITSTYISLNGIENQSCETFRFNKSKTDFDFCKTNGRPYDAVVVELLKLAKKHNSLVEPSSDGDAFDDPTGSEIIVGDIIE